MADTVHDVSNPYRIPAMEYEYPFHIFAGWFCENDEMTYQTGNFATFGVGDVYLRALWTEVPTVRITYHANHSDVQGTMENAVAEQYHDFVLPRGGYYVDGYRFVGWCTTADGSGDLLSAGTTIQVQADDLEFYAIWETVADPFTIIFDANGAEGFMPHVTIESGEEYVLPGGEGYTYAGHRFIGWNMEPDGSGRGYAAGHRVSFSNSQTLDITLYAQWEESDEVDGYYITFDGNGAVGYMALGVYVPGTPYIVPTCTMEYALHVFKGWNTREDGSGESYPVGARYVRSENITLYAQWEMPVRVIYYANNSTVFKKKFYSLTI